MEQSATQITKCNLGEYITPSLYTRNMQLQIEQLKDSFSGKGEVWAWFTKDVKENICQQWYLQKFCLHNKTTAYYLSESLLATEMNTYFPPIIV